MSNENLGIATSAIANGLMLTSLGVTEQVLSICLTVLGIISAVISIVYTVYKWYKKSTDVESDGGKSITKNEINDLFSQIKEEIEKEEKNNGDTNK